MVLQECLGYAPHDLQTELLCIYTIIIDLYNVDIVILK